MKIGSSLNNQNGKKKKNCEKISIIKQKKRKNYQNVTTKKNKFEKISKKLKKSLNID
jgi:hypothetical protein